MGNSILSLTPPKVWNIIEKNKPPPKGAKKHGLNTPFINTKKKVCNGFDPPHPLYENFHTFF